MKKMSIILALVLMLSVFAGIVSAADVLIGGQNTLASNLDEDDGEKYATATLPKSGCTFTLTNAEYISDANTVATNNVNVSISGSTIKARIPEILDAINPDTMSAFIETIGTYSCLNGSFEVASGSVKMQRENMYEMKKIYINSDSGVSATVNSESGDEVEDVKPGDILDIEVIGINNFDNDWNVDLDMEVTFLDFNSDIDFDDVDNLELGSDEEGSVTTTADVDTEIDSKTYKGKIKVLGQDDFGAYHGKQWTFEITVDRENYELNVVSMTLDPSTLICDGDKTVDAKVKIRNDGDRKDRSAKVEITSSALGLSQSLTNIELESTDEVVKMFRFTVPASTKPGMYDVTAKTYSLGQSLSDQETVKLVVPDCGQNVVVPTPVVTPTPQPTVVVTTPQPTPTPVVVSPKPVTTPTATATVTATPAEEVEESIVGGSNAMLYLVLLVVLMVVLLAAVIGLMVYLFKPNN